jgi:hypothetical protein
MLYKENIDEWMDDIEYIKVFTVGGDTAKAITIYRKLVLAATKLTLKQPVIGSCSM